VCTELTISFHWFCEISLLLVIYQSAKTMMIQTDTTTETATAMIIVELAVEEDEVLLPALDKKRGDF
jgi:hypothetical protein